MEASSHNQNDNNKCKNKKQPELIENRTVGKSDNQGDKEETLTQTGGRGRDGQLGGEGSGQGGSWRTGRPHIHVQKPGGTTGERDRPTTQGSSAGK